LATIPTIGTPPITKNATTSALRSGCAAAVCLVLAEGLHMAHADLAVWTTHMVMTQLAFTSFQKGVERIAGRALGIVVALVLLTVFRNAMHLGFAFECLALLVFFYVYFSNRLAYTFLNAGLYLAVIMQIGRADPYAAAPEGGRMFLAIIVGVVVADLVCWFSGAERDLTIQTSGAPFFPLDRGRLGQCVMLVVTVAISQLFVEYFALPASATLVSVMVLTVVPDLHQMLRKGGLRVLGVLLAMAYAFCSFVLLVRLQHFPLLVVLLFVGSYLATYLAEAGGDWAYMGVQMGLVLPMILVVPSHEFGTMTTALARLEGVVIAMACALLVGMVVAAFSRAAPAEPT